MARAPMEGSHGGLPSGGAPMEGVHGGVPDTAASPEAAAAEPPCCPAGHVMVFHSTEADPNLSCDKCHSGLGVTWFSCRECDYDLCHRCCGDVSSAQLAHEREKRSARRSGAAEPSPSVDPSPPASRPPKRKQPSKQAAQAAKASRVASAKKQATVERMRAMRAVQQAKKSSSRRGGKAPRR